MPFPATVLDLPVEVLVFDAEGRAPWVRRPPRSRGQARRRGVAHRRALRARNGRGLAAMTENPGAVAAEVQRLRAELAAARAEIARLQEGNQRLRAAPVEPAAPERGWMGAHRSERAPRLFPADEVGVVDATSAREDKSASSWRCSPAGPTSTPSAGRTRPPGGPGGRR